MKRASYRLLMLPSVSTLLVWMVVPLSMTIYFSLIRYNLLYPERSGFVGFDNFDFFVTDPAFFPAILNTLLLLFSIISITIILGISFALLVNRAFYGRNIVRLLFITPFFIMPTVNALIWKNMMFHPVYGILAFLFLTVGAEPIDWLSEYPLFSIVIIVALAMDTVRFSYFCYCFTII